MHEETQRSALEAMAEGQGAEGALASSGASPGESPYYNRIFWASYKGQSRGVWGGILLGGGLGSVAGLAIAGAATLASGAAFLALAPVIVPIAAVGGMMYAKDVFGTSGAVAGAVAAGMEISEERRHMEELGKAPVIGQAAAAPVAVGNAMQVAAPVNVMSDYTKVGHMASGELAYTGNEEFKLFGEKHHDIDERPLYFGKVGLAGAAIGGILTGAVAFVGGGIEHAVHDTDMFHHLVDKLKEDAVANAVQGVTGSAADVARATAEKAAESTANTLVNTVVTASGAAVGASYGVNRHYFRNVFNVSNALYDGHLDEIGKQKAQQDELEAIQAQAVMLQHQHAQAAAAPLVIASAMAAQPVGGVPTKNVNVRSAVLADRQVAAQEMPMGHAVS